MDQKPEPKFKPLNGLHQIIAIAPSGAVVAITDLIDQKAFSGWQIKVLVEDKGAANAPLEEEIARAVE